MKIYRPVPLEQKFIGIYEKDKYKQRYYFNVIAYEKALASITNGYQCMVFVHSRNDTIRTAEFFKQNATKKQHSDLFGWTDKNIQYEKAMKKLAKCKSNNLKLLFSAGYGIHHAGMTKHDRQLSASLFEQGLISVMFCTATLAWGVNLPAHTVIIKGTEIYNAEKGSFIDVGILDVKQIFGRAGRPQYESSGEAIIITTQEKLTKYLKLLTNSLPIESKFIDKLPDHLNAEIILGTVTNIREAISWLSYTYLYTRMLRNPLKYGITHLELSNDPLLYNFRQKLIEDRSYINEC